MNIQWNNVGNVGFEDLETYKKQLHSVVRMLTIVEKGITNQDPSHIMLTWLPEFNAISTHAWKSAGHTFRLGVIVEDLTLIIVRDGDKIESALNLDEVAQSDAYTWIKSEIDLVGINTTLLSEELPFDMDVFQLVPDLVYEVDHKEYGLELANYYSNAFELLNHFKSKRNQTSEFTISPLYLNLETSFPIHKGGTEELSIGFSPGDKYESDPYFYINTISSDLLLANQLLPLNGANWVKDEAWFGCKYSAKIFSRADQQLEICKDFLHDGQGYIKAIAA